MRCLVASIWVGFSGSPANGPFASVSLARDADAWFEESDAETCPRTMVVVNSTSVITSGILREERGRLGRWSASFRSSGDDFRAILSVADMRTPTAALRRA